MPALASKEYCTGCTACASTCPKGCIAMVADENGFLFPVVDAQKCVACSLCERSCPVISSLRTLKTQPSAYAAYSNDETVRQNSSSGGIFTEIAKVVLQRSGAVFGAAYNRQFEVVHICAENEEDLAKLRGAKYAQSDLNGVFIRAKQKLDAGQEVLFSGTPCQVAGLKAFLRKDYENLLTVDFVCHSVPSPMVWHEYVTYRARQDNGGELPESINLRSKATGWSRYQYSNLFEYANSPDHIATSGESLYMKLFVDGYINRESCETCRFKGYSRISDLTIGDFWGIWDIAPEMDDNKGTSVVFVQSQRGKEIFALIKKCCIVRTVSLEEASVQNQSILKCSPSNVHRAEVLQLTQSGDFERCKELFATPKVSLGKKIFRKLKALRSRMPPRN